MELRISDLCIKGIKMLIGLMLKISDRNPKKSTPTIRPSNSILTLINLPSRLATKIVTLG